MRAAPFALGLAALVAACGDSRSTPPAPVLPVVTPVHAPPSAPPSTPSLASPTPPIPTSPPLLAPSTPTPATAPAATPSRPLSYERAIVAADLEGRSLRELSILRNMPFAKRGHTFRRPWLVAYFGAQPWYHAARTVEIAELPELDRNNVDVVARADLGLSRGALEHMRTELVARDARGALREGDEVEAVLLGSRLGTRIALSHGAAGSGADPTVTALEDPSRLDALLTVEELRRVSRRDLRILRNTVYARRGRTFRSGLIRDYFAAESWYQPNAAYTDALLTEMDRQNIRMIQSVEEENGGPLRGGGGDDMVAA